MNHTHSIPPHSHRLNNHTHGTGNSTQNYFAIAPSNRLLKTINVDGGDYKGILTANGKTAMTVTQTTGAASGNTASSDILYTNESALKITNDIGGGQGHTHSINPPYIQVYAWKRTA